MYLLVIDSMSHSIGCNPTSATIFTSFIELFSMRWGISDMENISQTWDHWIISPGEVTCCNKKTIVDSFGKITATECIQFLDVVSDCSVVGEILDFGDVG